MKEHVEKEETKINIAEKTKNKVSLVISDNIRDKLVDSFTKNIGIDLVRTTAVRSPEKKFTASMINNKANSIYKFKMSFLESNESETPVFTKTTKDMTPDA
jgi:hypothetical protein